MKKTIIIFAASIMLLFLILGCPNVLGEFDNPLDPDSDNFDGFTTVSDEEAVVMESVEWDGNYLVFKSSLCIGTESYTLELSSSETDFSGGLFVTRTETMNSWDIHNFLIKVPTIYYRYKVGTAAWSGVYSCSGVNPEGNMTKLTASDSAADSFFGRKVRISGNGETVITGAYGDDDNGSSSGSAYIFKWDGSDWVETKLTASDNAAGDYFGCAVSVSYDGETILIGAYGDDDNGSFSGSAYVFNWNGSEWVERKLTATNGTESSYFGSSVSISGDGDTVIVGVPNWDYSYIYKWNGTEWVEETLLASDRQLGDDFGRSVSICANGGTVLIGAPRDDDNGNWSGSAYVYKWDGSSWIEEKLIASDVSASDQFGRSVNISSDGEALIVGSVGDDDNGSNSGSAYVYKWNCSNWMQNKLASSDSAESDNFGGSVSISGDGDKIIVGAYGDDGSGNYSGSAYIYNWDGSDWFEEKLRVTTGGEQDSFGFSTSISTGRDSPS